MKKPYHQDSFIGGEISPRYISQTNRDLAAISLLECINFIPLLQGPVTRRNGTQHLANVVVGPGDARIMPFITPDNKKAVALFRAGTMNVISDIFNIGDLETGAPPPAEPPTQSEQLISNNDFTDNNVGWDIYGVVNNNEVPPIADDPGGQKFPDNREARYYGRVPANNRRATKQNSPIDITVSNEMVLDVETTKLEDQRPHLQPYFGQMIDVPIASDFVTVLVRVALPEGKIPFRDDNVNDIEYARAGLRVMIGTTDGGTDVWDQEYYPPVWDINGAGYKAAGATTRNWQIVTFQAPTPSAGYTGPLHVRIALASPADDYFTSDDPVVRRMHYTAIIDRVNVFTESQSIPDNPSFTTPYMEEDLEQLHYIQSPFDEQELILLSPNHEPYALYFDEVGSDWVFEPYPFVGPPPEWGVDNWPSVGAGYQGRLVLAGAKRDSETVWTSKSSVWRDFTRDTGGDLVASSAITFTMTSRDIITWLSGRKGLVYGSIEGEYTVKSFSGLLTPDDIQVDQQLSHGAPRQMVLGVDKSIVVATTAGRNLRQLMISYENQGVVSVDISLQAEHLFSSGVKRLAYSRDPHPTIWALMNDGTLVAATYEEGRVLAWHRVDTGDDVRDIITFTASDGRSIPLMLVERVTAGERVLALEAFNNLRTMKNWIYLDRHKAVPIPQGTNSIAGFDHLEAQEVSIFVDNTYVGDTIVLDGTVGIPIEGNICTVGTGYTSRIASMPSAVQLGAGETMDSSKRWVRAGVRAISSRPPVINGDRQSEIPQDVQMDVNTPASARENYYSIGAGYSNFDQIIVEENEPFALTVTGLFGTIKSNEVA